MAGGGLLYVSALAFPTSTFALKRARKRWALASHLRMARAFHNLGRTIGGAGVVCPSRFLRTYAIHCLFPIRTLGVGEHQKKLGGEMPPSSLCASTHPHYPPFVRPPALACVDPLLCTPCPFSRTALQFP